VALGYPSSVVDTLATTNPGSILAITTKRMVKKTTTTMRTKSKATTKTRAATKTRTIRLIV